MSRQGQNLSSVLPCAVVLTILAGAAPAQSASTTTAPPAAAQPRASTENPKGDTLTRLDRAMSIAFHEHRLEDVMKFIGEATGAEIEVFWTDDKNPIGLDKDTPITLNFERGTALDLLEKVLAKATTDTTGAGNSWQLSENGTLQVGPKERLNAFRQVKIYSIADLIVETPNYSNAPDFDLQSVLQNQGGNAGQSPFKDNGEKNVQKTPQPDRIEELQKILMAIIEPDQWTNNGGNAASIRYFHGSFIVNAPDYIQRQIIEYPHRSRAVARTNTSS